MQESSEVIKLTKKKMEGASQMMGAMGAMMGNASAMKRAMAAQTQAAAETAAKEFEEEFHSKKVCRCLASSASALKPLF